MFLFILENPGSVPVCWTCVLVSAHILTTGVLWISAVDNASTGYESPQVSCFAACAVQHNQKYSVTRFAHSFCSLVVYVL